MNARAETRRMGATGRAPRYEYAGWLLCALFAMRVAAQGLQRWSPQPFLPPFDAFQGSALPYGVLLPAQLVILAVMVRSTKRMGAGTLRRNARVGIVLGWLAAIYLLASVARIVIGLAVAGAPAWFRAWIPASFHLVLAGFVLLVACRHLEARAR